MVQCPGIVGTLDRMFAPDVFPQPPQNIATEISIHSLSWWNEFLMHDAFSVKKTNQHCFELVMLSWGSVNLASSTEMIAISSQDRIHKPKIHHQ
jgi:hypothetical protein